MPRFYFDQDDHLDLLGADLPDLPAACRYALRLAGDLIRDLDAADTAAVGLRLAIGDAARRPLALLTFDLDRLDTLVSVRSASMM